MFRRIIFVLGLAPVLVFLVFRWIVTGEDAFDTMSKFQDWADNA